MTLEDDETVAPPDSPQTAPRAHVTPYEANDPARATVKPVSGSGGRVTFVAEPLESGFGLTLGNALRRVLLSSLQGASVTAIKIDNVLHEFSSLAGVREDVTDIVLNVKQLALRMETDEAKRLHLNAVGPSTVTAGMIATSGDIEVMNPDLIICHLDEGATLNMELSVSTGKGYVPAAQNRPDAAPIGLIPIDALYSPVRQVAYKVERGGMSATEAHDRLTITIETNRTVTPLDAVAYAARILQDQLRLFTHRQGDLQEIFLAEDENVASPAEVTDEAEPEILDRYLRIRVAELGLSMRSTTVMRSENIVYVGDLARMSEPELLRGANFGRKSLREISAVLATMGLRLGMDLPGWPPEQIEDPAGP